MSVIDMAYEQGFLLGVSPMDGECSAHLADYGNTVVVSCADMRGARYRLNVLTLDASRSLRDALVALNLGNNKEKPL